MECTLLSARTGNAYYTQLFNKWQFYPLPCTVWTWTLDNVHTYFSDILRATLKLNLTYVGSYCTKQPNMGCWQHGTFSTFMWTVLILGSADHFLTISFWTINWHSGYFNLGNVHTDFKVFISLPFWDRSCTVVICTRNRVPEPGSKIHYPVPNLGNWYPFFLHWLLLKPMKISLLATFVAKFGAAGEIQFSHFHWQSIHI